MGRATVSGGGTDGLYSVLLDLGVARRDARVARIDTRLAELEPQIVAKQLALSVADAALTEAREAADAAIDVLAAARQADPGADHSALTKAVQDALQLVMECEAKVAEVRIPLGLLMGERTELQRGKGALQALQLAPTRAVWCVDLTEDASGEVATLEVPGEPQKLLMAPGGRVPAADDGFLLARQVMSPAQAFFNAAILPGWQRHKPTYRVGELVALDKDADLATVALDVAVSSAQGLPVNEAGTLVDIPVVYMTCNAAPFEVGDRVVVELPGRSWAAPRVIGFESNPRPCGAQPDLYFHIWAEFDPYVPALGSATTANFFFLVSWSEVCGSFVFELLTPRALSAQKKRMYAGTTYQFLGEASGLTLTPPGKKVAFEDTHWFPTLDPANRVELEVYSNGLTPGVPEKVSGYWQIRRRTWVSTPASYPPQYGGCGQPAVAGWVTQGECSVDGVLVGEPPVWEVVADINVTPMEEILAMFSEMPAEVEATRAGKTYRYLKTRVDTAPTGEWCVVYVNA